MEMNELSQKAMGGTELMLHRLHHSIDNDLLKEFQIIPTRVRNLDPNKFRILWIHDTCEDPETYHLASNGWMKFHKLVFVSYHQMNSFIRKYNILPSKCIVIENGIIPIDISDQYINEKFQKPELKMIYTSTPHRGLEILVPIFNEIKNSYPFIHLDVFSSFTLYGWPERDSQYKNVIELCKTSNGINYHGSQPNSVIREHLKDASLFVYPSIWEETSCLCLIEAMSAGCISVHSSLGALPETSLKLNYMYDYHEDSAIHKERFKKQLCSILDEYKTHNSLFISQAQSIKKSADNIYDWNVLTGKWQELLESIKNESLSKPIRKERFIYNTDGK